MAKDYQDKYLQLIQHETNLFHLAKEYQKEAVFFKNSADDWLKNSDEFTLRANDLSREAKELQRKNGVMLRHLNQTHYLHDFSRTIRNVVHQPHFGVKKIVLPLFIEDDETEEKIMDILRAMAVESKLIPRKNSPVLVDSSWENENYVLILSSKKM